VLPTRGPADAGANAADISKDRCMRRTLLTRLSRVERKAPERCPACGPVPNQQDRRGTGLMLEYEGVRMTCVGTRVPPEDLKACTPCGRPRRYCSKVIVRINPLLR